MTDQAMTDIKIVLFIFAVHNTIIFSYHLVEDNHFNAMKINLLSSMVDVNVSHVFHQAAYVKA